MPRVFLCLPDGCVWVRGMLQIPLRGRNGVPRAFALIDDTDAPLVTGRRWRLLRTQRGKHYATSGGYGQPIVLMHRLIADTPAELEVDHMNGDGLDNRRQNLRNVTHAQNQQNKRANKAARSQYRGVHRCAGKWRAQVTFNDKRIHLGYFAAELDAAKAAADWRKAHMPYAIEAM